MKKILAALLTLPLSACLYTINLPGPDGQMHRVVPMYGTQIVRVYNRCSSTLIVSGPDHRVVIRQNDDANLVLPVLPNENRYDAKDIVLDARGGSNQELGTKRVTMQPDQYQAILARRQMVIGGAEGDVRITGVC